MAIVDEHVSVSAVEDEAKIVKVEVNLSLCLAKYQAMKITAEPEV
jgi:hypothetical protein